MLKNVHLELKIIMKHSNIYIFISFFFIISSFGQKNNQNVKNTDLTHYLKQIEKENLITHVTTLAADKMEGRRTGETGQKKAAAYIRDFYELQNISAAKGTSNYYQKVPSEFMQRPFSPTLSDSENVIAFIKGSEFPDQYIVLSAHYDHIGMANGEIYNGADDNASGTTAVLEIARVFQKAVKEGKGPKRSVIFLHCTGEEYGLHGSRFYTQYPLYPLEQTIANLNVDMIGRIDDKHIGTGDYIYLVGADRLSKDLHNLSEATNKKYTNLILDYTYNDPNDREMIYYRSDHYNFAKNNVPAIFYYNGTHADYHKPTDTSDKIMYDAMLPRVQLIFATLWELANSNKPIKRNN